MFILKWKKWPMSRIIFAVAGSFTFIGILLGVYLNPYFFILPALVGLMQIIFAFTGVCPLAMILNKNGVKCDLAKN